jgi:hypothetical protein
LHQRRFLRSGENPLARAARLAVDARANIGEYLWHVLHFIEDRWRLHGVEKSLRIGAQPRFLAAYYDSLTEGAVEGISRFFDETVTLITLAGGSSVNGSKSIENIYRRLVKTWDSNGLSSKIGYSRSQFVSTNVQDNVKIVRTRLTNFTQSGEAFQSWNCTYVLCNRHDGWKITLATSDNETTASTSLD